jgi:hypothetical protein
LLAVGNGDEDGIYRGRASGDELAREQEDGADGEGEALWDPSCGF